MCEKTEYAVLKVFFLLMFMAAGYKPLFGADESLFYRQVEAGDSKALERAFKELAVADASKGEDLSIAIGKTITLHPKRFLVYLKKYRAQIVRLDSLVGNLGEEFVDDFTK